MANVTAADIKSFGLPKKSVDLRSTIAGFGLDPPRSQRPRGLCTCFATAFLVEFITCKTQGKKGLDYSEEYLNAMSNRVNGVKKDGTSYVDCINAYHKHGIVDEAKAPYKKTFDPNFLQGNDEATLDLIAEGEKKKSFKISITFSPKNGESPVNYGLTTEQVGTILNHVAAGRPVAIGYRGDKANTKTVKLSNGFSALSDIKGSNPEQLYAHNVVIVGYFADPTPHIRTQHYVIFRNSFALEVGDDGYQFMTLNYLQKFAYDYLIAENKPKNVPSIPPLTMPANLPRLPFLDPVGALGLDRLMRPS